MHNDLTFHPHNNKHALFKKINTISEFELTSSKGSTTFIRSIYKETVLIQSNHLVLQIFQVFGTWISVTINCKPCQSIHLITHLSQFQMIVESSLLVQIHGFVIVDLNGSVNYFVIILTLILISRDVLLLVCHPSMDVLPLVHHFETTTSAPLLIIHCHLLEPPYHLLDGSF